jgi:hypothetical protein
MNAPVAIRHSDGSVSYSHCCREETPRPEKLIRHPSPRTAVAFRGKHAWVLFTAALALATVLFWLTMLTAPPTSQAALSSPESDAPCMEVGRRVGLWFETEIHRRAWIRASRHDNFNLMLTWFRTVQSQCASGHTDAALESLRALEGMIAALDGHRRTDEDK